jgi:putative ABC transport system permease protein
MLFVIRLICCLFLLGYVPLLVYLLYSDKGRRGMMLALRSLRLHKLRAFLSVLGIIIGTTSVITLMAFGEGSMHDALEAIKRLGATNIIVRSVKPPDDSSTSRRTRTAIYGLTTDDYERFLTIGSVVRRVPMRIFPQEIRDTSWRKLNGRVVATLPEYTDVNQVQLACGRFLTDKDEHEMDNVAVLGGNVADSLYPFENPLGKEVRLGSYVYSIVGVLKDRTPITAAGGSGQPDENFNNDVYIPLSTCKGRFGERIVNRMPGSFSAEQVQLHQVTLTISDMDQVRPSGDVVRDLLQRFHEKPDWSVTVPLDRLKEAEDTRDRFTGLLVMIAFISLLVGGIGIMNIMLATVTERTREIGIRRALGAKRRDITLQFMIEAVVQTSLGGMIGVLMGLSIVFLVPLFWQWVAGKHLPAQINIDPLLISVVVSVTVGVIFGLYPAWKASRLDPIEALRHE